MFDLDTRRAEVTIVRMGHGKVNAFDSEFADGFLSAWSEAVERGSPIVLAGNDRVFSAGFNLKVLPTLDLGGLVEFFESFTRVTEAVLDAPSPVVAAVGGPAIAGGAVLALAADVRVVDRRARMALTEVSVGVEFPPPALAVCARALPANEHGPALLQALERTGDDLVARGWAHHVAAGSSATRGLTPVEDAAASVAGRMCGHDAETFAAVKRALNRDVTEEHRRFRGKAVEEYAQRVMKRGLDRVQTPGS